MTKIITSLACAFCVSRQHDKCFMTKPATNPLKDSLAYVCRCYLAKHS